LARIYYFTIQEQVDPEVEEIRSLLSEYAYEIFENGLYLKDIYNLLVDLYFDAHEKGYVEAKLDMIQQIEEDLMGE
jgi:hypothetical protein